MGEIPWNLIKRFKLLLAGLILILAFLAYWPIVGGSLRDALGAFWSDVLPNLGAAVLIYIAISIILVRAGVSDLQELRDDIAKRVALSVVPAPGILGVHKYVNQFDWQTAFETARRVDIVGRFFDAPVREARDGLVNFFKAGGTVRVFTFDPKEDCLLNRLFATKRGERPRRLAVR
jgi:hypothetical protein